VTYPARQPFFAYKYTRLLSKVCAPHELGPYATLLCVTIAMQEDAIRYTRAVTFFNEYLANLVGVSKWETLNKARSRAVSKGWLHYENQGRRKPGLYWVSVPDVHQDLMAADGPMSEGLLPPDAGYKRGYNDGYKRGYNDGHNGGDASTLVPPPGPEAGLGDGQPPPPALSVDDWFNRLLPHILCEKHEVGAWKELIRSFGGSTVQRAMKTCREERVAKDLPRRPCLSDTTSMLRDYHAAKRSKQSEVSDE